MKYLLCDYFMSKDYVKAVPQGTIITNNLYAFELWKKVFLQKISLTCDDDSTVILI